MGSSQHLLSRFRYWLERVIGFVAFFVIVIPVGVILLLKVGLSFKELIFIQERIGVNGEIFWLYKFRTMKREAAEQPTHLADPKMVTKFGGMLRRTKIDELPQLINIAKGEMRFVGPRPCLPSQKEVIAERKKLGVLSSLPGITGLAQVQGIDMSEPKLLAECDACYLDNKTLLNDFKIVLLTLFGKGVGDKIK